MTTLCECCVLFGAVCVTFVDLGVCWCAAHAFELAVAHVRVACDHGLQAPESCACVNLWLLCELRVPGQGRSPAGARRCGPNRRPRLSSAPHGSCGSGSQARTKSEYP